ncbi:MAG: glycosyltransferase family 39 protein [Cyanobacteria bacterium P01_C01_bin.69]
MNERISKATQLLIIGTVLVLGLLLGTLGYFSLDKQPLTVSTINWASDVQWMSDRSATYNFYARSKVVLPGPAQGAWLRISAENDFSLYINGKPVATENFARAFKVSKETYIGNSNQSLDDDSAYLALNPPVFLAHSDDWKITFYSDITPYLVPGENTIAISAHSSQQDVRVAIEGNIYPTRDGPPLKIRSGNDTWRSSPVAINHQGIRWFDSSFSDADWATARALGPVTEATYSRLSPHLFDRLLQGSWIGGQETPTGEVLLQKNWIVSPKSQQSYIRFAAAGDYSLLLNGHLISPEREENRALHIMAVKNYLHTGSNSLSVRLRRPLVSANAIKTNTEYIPLSFYLDGWSEDRQGQIIDAIATDSTWESPLLRSAGLIKSPTASQLLKTFEGDAYLKNYPDSFVRRLLWNFGGMLLSGSLIFTLGYLWHINAAHEPRQLTWHRLAAGAALMLPGTLYLLGILLLRHRYAEDEEVLWFVQPHSNSIIIAGFFLVMFMTLSWSWINKAARIHTPPSKRLTNISGIQGKRTWLITAMLIAVLLATLLLRVYGLGDAAFFADEGTTLDTARGILNNGGAPILTAGIWYTRSPAYHYMLALWLALWGESGHSARLLSAFWGVATTAVIFFFTRRLTGSPWIALLASALLAFDPSQILGARIIRFYQATQCLTMLSFWLFYEGYILSQAKQSKYRFLFLLCLAATLLNLETSFILLPCFVAGFFYCYRRIQLRYDWQLVVISAVILTIFTYDMALFSWRCLTPSLAMSISTGSIVQPNLFDLSSFGISFLSGAAARISILYSFFFLIGFGYFTWQKRGDLFFFFSSIVIYVAELSVLIMQTRTRYFYIIYPLFVILAVYTAVCLMQKLGEKFEEALAHRLPLKNICIVAVGLLLFFNLKLVDVFRAYGDNITDRQVEMFDYIREHREPEDIVIAFQPQAQLAAINLSKLDYLLVNEPRFDHLYEDSEGKIIDRWAGATAIFNVDQFRQILESTPGRVWITSSSADPPRKSNPLTPYATNLGKTVFETYGGHLRLWQPDDGLIIRMPSQNGDVSTF